MKATDVFGILLCAVLLATCATVPKKSKSPDGFMPPDPTTSERAQPSLADQAQLWSDADPSGWLFSDRKARRVNDIVTIKIVESATAKKKAATKLSKQNEVGAGMSGLVGLEDLLARYNPNMELGTMLDAKHDSKFTGSGETERSGKLAATIAAVVTEVLPNGNLAIEGRKEIRVNDETQILIITGIVRPDDIDASNSVLSSRVAQTKIQFIGKGVASDRQRPGWLSRFIDKVWPF